MGISTHILDLSSGRPAAAVPLSLARLEADSWLILNTSFTDADGRCKHLLPESNPLLPGTYRIRFDTAAYNRQQQLRGLYPFIEIIFEIADGTQHYHLPLLLTANGYTTYRGT